MRNFIIFVLFTIVSLGYCQNNYKICLHTSDSINYCDQLNRENTAVQCIKAADSVECTQKVQNGEADFTVLFSEQAYLASGFENDKTSVIAEVRAEKKDAQPHSFQMVVVVSKDHKGGLNGLRNKKYCHPGFSGHDLWTPRVLKEFEYLHFGEKIKRNCNEKENVSYVEQEVKVLDEFFGESCRPGPWSENTELNDQLVKKYPKLTALCKKDSKDQDSLSCLKMQNADLAYTTLTDALTMPDKDNFRLLCQNDSLVPIRYGIPPICSWRNQPWPIVLSQRGKAAEIQNNLRTWIHSDYIAAPPGSPFSASGKASRQDWQKTLEKILLQDTQQFRLNILSDTPLLQDFFLRNNQKLESYVQSDCPMRWCTVNQKEQEKCEWFARASSYAGVEPQVSCIAGEHIYDCLLKIRQNNADIIAIDSNYGYLARKMGLSNLLYSENWAQDIASIIAVIRAEDSSIRSFKDLKNKNACFPEYRGLAWVSFINSARRHGLMKNNCEFGKSVSDFFIQICAPGAKDNYHYRQNNEMYDKLCSLCSDNCESNENNKFFNNTGALSCLDDNRADVAFVEWQAIEKEPNLGNYKILCDDGNILTIDEYKTQTDKCSLSNTVDSEVIARHNDSRRTDYKLGLLKMDNQFGTEFRNEATFKLFKEFKGEKNLLFKENVLGVADGQSASVYVQNYIKLFESVDKCANSGSIVQFSVITLLLASLIVLFNRQMS